MQDGYILQVPYLIEVISIKLCAARAGWNNSHELYGEYILVRCRAYINYNYLNRLRARVNK